VITNHYVVHQITFFHIVEPSLIHHIIPWLANFDQGFVDGLDAT
jgi:hypothetical protein